MPFTNFIACWLEKIFYKNWPSFNINIVTTNYDLFYLKIPVDNEAISLTLVTQFLIFPYLLVHAFSSATSNSTQAQIPYYEIQYAYPSS